MCFSVHTHCFKFQQKIVKYWKNIKESEATIFLTHLTHTYGTLRPAGWFIWCQSQESCFLALWPPRVYKSAPVYKCHTCQCSFHSGAFAVVADTVTISAFVFAATDLSNFLWWGGMFCWACSLTIGKNRNKSTAWQTWSRFKFSFFCCLFQKISQLYTRRNSFIPIKHFTRV